MSKFDWHEMSLTEKQSFIRDSIEQNHKKKYQWALWITDRTGPTWEELTEEQRDHIRKINDQYEHEMQEFGESLAEKK